MLLALAGCGDKDFKNQPRPPVAVQLTGVITKSKVVVSPNRLGGGPIVLTVSNQTPDSHKVQLVGNATGGNQSTKVQQVKETVGPVNPMDTATIQQTLPEGQYEVRALFEKAIPESKRVEPATLIIGRSRPSGSNKLLLP